MNNILNSNLLGLLSGVDKDKLNQVSNMVRNMSKDDLNNLVNMLGINNNTNINNVPTEEQFKGNNNERFPE